MKVAQSVVKIGIASILGLATVSSFAYGGNSGRDESSQWTTVDPQYTQGVSEIKAEKFDEGIRALEAYTARVKTNADAENWLGYAYRRSGKLDDAFAHYDRALALNPKHRGAHEYVAEAYLMIGNLPKAEEHMRALDALCPASCIESDLLHKAIAEYKKAHPSTADATPAVEASGSPASAQ